MTRVSIMTVVFPAERGGRFAHRVIVSLSRYLVVLHTECAMRVVLHMRVVMVPPLVEHLLRLVPRMGFMLPLSNRVVMGVEIMARVPTEVARPEA